MFGNAAARVFSVAELLENILDFLPPPEFGELSDPQLFVLQRVDRTFRDTIAGSPRLSKRMFEVEPDMCRQWLYGEKKAFWAERTLCAIQKKSSNLMRTFQDEFLIRLRSDSAVDEGIQAMTKESTTGSWRRVKLVRDSATSPVVVIAPMLSAIDWWAFAEPGTTLGELLDGEWVDDAKKLLSKTSKDGVHLAVEDWSDRF
ncbi:hypothetical protein AC579_8039 [Pseudocercospora musae]|uniref:F-box domain-containing protein n=1 Tax=Pseudocercospora musae TaxID=113226 RepID=A0A139IPG4_9PEZI|nr:hypothetical protein AC579_8039 [Pseudocercospora musae]